MTTSKRVSDFMLDIKALCHFHKLTIAHESNHGMFQIVDLNPGDLGHLMDADDCTKTDQTLLTRIQEPGT